MRLAGMTDYALRLLIYLGRQPAPFALLCRVLVSVPDGHDTVLNHLLEVSEFGTQALYSRLIVRAQGHAVFGNALSTLVAPAQPGYGHAMLQDESAQIVLTHATDFL